MKKISGLITALITPFKNNKVDYTSLEKLVNKQIASGVEGFVINGTTGESPTLNDSEVEEIFKFIRKITKEEVPLILGTGTNCTVSTIEKTKKAERLGASAALVVVPYYNKPPQRGLFSHFMKIADSSKTPIILYNVPGRTITSLEVDTIVKLSEHPNIIGIKEASGSKEMAAEIRQKSRSNFILLSGDDGTYVDFLEAGGDGVISVASHIIPGPMRQWRSLVMEGKSQQAKEDLKKWLPLINLLFVEANPIPVKKATQILHLIDSAELRLPLVELESDKTILLLNEMQLQRLV